MPRPTVPVIRILYWGQTVVKIRHELLHICRSIQHIRTAVGLLAPGRLIMSTSLGKTTRITINKTITETDIKLDIRALLGILVEP